MSMEVEHRTVQMSTCGHSMVQEPRNGLLLWLSEHVLRLTR